MVLARSGVAPMAAMTISSLSVARNGTRLAPVICCSSSSTPSAAAMFLAISTSRPTGWLLASLEPNGATSTGTPILTLPEAMIACRSAERAGPAVTAPARSTAETILERCFNIVVPFCLVGSWSWLVQDRAQEAPEFGCTRLEQGVPRRAVLMDVALVHEDHPISDVLGEVHLV